MELIANLPQTHVSEGLTPENLRYLEQIFYDAVGDNQEIDLENFKKIAQSKNKFFVERFFEVFDADKSGAVSLEEFLKVMRCIAGQSPVEKLRYLFQVYDINNDGTIELEELRRVIGECLAENGLKFDERQTDELTRMLFEDADADGSGSVSFDEFRAQLERQPAFMDNLTRSIERWLLPPVKPKRKTPLLSLLPDATTWRHMRNNWTGVTYLSVYFLVNLVLFATRAFQYREDNGFVIVARACGQCLNFNCSFVVVLVLRQTLTWLRTNGFSQYFPIDQHLYYHKLTGWVILAFSLLHTATHIGNFCLLSIEKNVPLEELLTSTHLGIGWAGGAACLTGWILLLVLVIMCVSAMPFVRRSGKFEVFYCLHLLSFLFWMCLILHGPNFWKWFLGPAVFFIAECTIRINRNLSSGKLAYVQQGILLPSKVSHLVVKRPPKFDYRPGDYVYINIPSIAKFEWHPFTISSAPEMDEVLWLHIRGVGEWTNSLYNSFQIEDREAILSDELARTLGDPQTSTKPNGSFTDSQKTSSHVTNSSKNSLNDVTFACPSAKAQSDSVRALQSLSLPQTNSLSDSFLNPSLCSESSLNDTVIEMEPRRSNTFLIAVRNSVGSSTSARSDSAWRRTSFTSTSTSRAIQRKNKEDIRKMLAEHSRLETSNEDETSRLSVKRRPKEKRKSVRVSIAKRGLRKCQTVIVMPTVAEEDEDEGKLDIENDSPPTEEEIKDLIRETEVENVIIRQAPLKIFLDGPYGSPTRHIFQAKHAVLIATGIGVTPFASILQSIMFQYRKSKHTCPSCSHKWSDPLPVSSIHLKKVDFFWLNRNQQAFEWFVSLLGELEAEQAQLRERDRFLDMHMYITSALGRGDLKAAGLHLALDLLYDRHQRDLITGLKSRTQPGRPDWHQVFTSIAQQKKGKVTVFFCGPDQLAKTLQSKCDEFKFRFRKEIF